MTGRPNRRWATLVLGCVAVAMVALAIPLAEPVWLWVTTRRVTLREFYPGRRPVVDGHEVRGWYRIQRDRPRIRHGQAVWYFIENGRKAGESEWSEGRRLRVTYWSFDGEVLEQERLLVDRTPWHQDARTAPPWWWAVEPQRRPTAPWW